MTLEEFERQINEIAGQDFTLEIQAKYKEKQVAVNLSDDDVWFFSTATRYDAALDSILGQLRGYMDGKREEA